MLKGNGSKNAASRPWVRRLLDRYLFWVRGKVETAAQKLPAYRKGLVEDMLQRRAYMVCVHSRGLP